MIPYSVYNITGEGHVGREYIESIITDATAFLCQNIDSVDKLCFNFHCIISNDYWKDVQKYHGKPGDPDYSNGIYIPPFYQKEPKDKSIIIFNWPKICRYTKSFITSVFIHEFTHFLDYRLCTKLENRYGRLFLLDVELNTFPDRIGGLHCMRSEMRAKYFQEKYMCSLASTPRDIIARINNYAESISAPDDYYHIVRLSGQVKCWNEYAQSDINLRPAISHVTSNLKGIFSENPLSNYFEVFSEECFFDKCEKFYNEFYPQS